MVSGQELADCIGNSDDLGVEVWLGTLRFQNSPVQQNRFEKTGSRIR